MRFIACLLVLAALAGCGTANRTYSYTPPPKPGGRMCTNQCDLARRFCHETCDLQQRSCINNGQSRAMEDYDRYMRDQITTHDDTQFTPSDFERLEPCKKSHKSCTDQCDTTYNSCYENCGGTVNVTTSCEFLCF